MRMIKIREILEKFKNFCSLQGWKTSEKNDWIKTENKYHAFLWIRSIHPSSFKSVTANRKCVVQDDLSYRVVEPSYTAWLFQDAPSETLVETIFEDPDFCKRIALYDLSPALEGKQLGYKLNRTDSPVFQEFERFLEKELKVKLKSISDPEINCNEHALTKLA